MGNNKQGKIYKSDEVKEIIKNNKDNIAFVIGNGINRYKKNGKDDKAKTWENLLHKLTKKHLGEIEKLRKGISYTELYDIYDLENENVKCQKKVCEILAAWKQKDSHRNVIEFAKSLDIPIMTTNYDSLLSDNLDFFKFGIKGFSDFYPWSCYFSNRKLMIPSDGFAVWHIHGIIKYYRSIRLGLNHYIGLIHKASKFIKYGEDCLHRVSNNSEWLGSKTWLDLFFKKSIIMFGLGLEKDEIFLRWLLLERSKFIKKKKLNLKSYFIDKESNIEGSKCYFLENVGFEVIKVNGYKDIYEII